MHLVCVGNTDSLESRRLRRFTKLDMTLGSVSETSSMSHDDLDTRQQASHQLKLLDGREDAITAPKKARE